MCRSCNGITNVRERIANHDFMEQMREFYGLNGKPLKDRKCKNMKKSVLAKIEYQLQQLQDRIEEEGFKQVHHRLADLLDHPFSTSTVQAFDSIMDDYNALLKAEIIAHLKE